MKGERMTMNMNEKLANVIGYISGSISPDKDSKDEKVTVHLVIDYSECTFADVLAWSNDNRKIAWASTGRKHIGTLTDGQTIRIKASSPGRRVVDPVASTKAMLQGMTKEEKEQWIADNLM